MKKLNLISALVILFLSLNSFSQSKFVINNFDVEIELVVRSKNAATAAKEHHAGHEDCCQKS